MSDKPIWSRYSYLPKPVEWVITSREDLVEAVKAFGLSWRHGFGHLNQPICTLSYQSKEFDRFLHAVKLLRAYSVLVITNDATVDRSLMRGAMDLSDKEIVFSGNVPSKPGWGQFIHYRIRAMDNHFRGYVGCDPTDLLLLQNIQQALCKEDIIAGIGSSYRAGRAPEQICWMGVDLMDFSYKTPLDLNRAINKLSTLVMNCRDRCTASN